MKLAAASSPSRLASPFSLWTIGFLLISLLGLSGCAGALVGVGTAAVAASSTEKGFSTSVSDKVIPVSYTHLTLPTICSV